MNSIKKRRKVKGEIENWKEKKEKREKKWIALEYLLLLLFNKKYHLFNSPKNIFYFIYLLLF